MAPLVLDDAAEQILEYRMPGLADKGPITGERRELVDRSDRQVHGREVLEQPRPDHGRQEADAVLEAQVGAHVRDAVLRVELDPVEIQELADVLAVPQLLVVPAREECGEDRVHAGAGDEQVREVQRDVIFDVHHVVETEQVPFRQRVGGHGLPINPRDVQLPGLLFVPLDAEAHPSSIRSCRACPSIRTPAGAGSFSSE